MPPGDCYIISNERLGGHPLSNGIDRSAVCRRLRSVVPQAKVLLVIREQRSMILSNYMQYLHFGGAARIESYLKGKNDGKVPALSPAFWQYDRLIALYQNAFGAENLLVLPFELFASDPPAFVERICHFVGLDPPKSIQSDTKANARPDYFAYNCLRYASPLFRSSRGNAFAPSLLGKKTGKAVHTTLQKWAGALVPVALNKRTKHALLRRIEKATAGLYCDSNRASSAMIGIDLAIFGYDSGTTTLESKQ